MRDILSSVLGRLRRASRRIWVRTTLFAFLALAAHATARVAGPAVPDSLTDIVSDSALIDILTILASSMLAVTIFSVSTLVSIRQSASSQASPRAHQLFIQDPATQTVMATFLGAFVFSLTALIYAHAQIYGDGAQAIILAFTLFVTGMVVLAMIRWIAHVADLGSVEETIRRVETAARLAIDERSRRPGLGAAAPVDRQYGTTAVKADRTGYVTYIDLGRLSDLAERAPGRVHLAVTPGDLVARGGSVAHLEGKVDPTAVRAAVTLAPTRDYDQDPRFGITVLAEIGQRALSPGINDPRTAMNVIGRLLGLLLDTALIETEQTPDFPRVHLAPMSASDLLDDAFAGIARDGAATVEVQVLLQEALASLSRVPDTDMAEAARAQARRALELARDALPHEGDGARVSKAATVA